MSDMENAEDALAAEFLPDGGVPTWFTYILVARFLNTTPWELVKKPAIWFWWGLITMNVIDELKAQHGPETTVSTEWVK